MKKTWTWGLLALGTAALIYGCTQPSAKMADASIKGSIEDRDGHKLTNATVWLIPSTDVAAMGKTPIEIKKDAKNDEPLEDNLAANRDRYMKGQSGADGNFTIPNVPGGKYFLYVEPADATYLPGGDKSRKSLSAAEMSAAPVKIQVSGNTPAGATYVGTSKCLDCHEEHEGFKSTLHRLGIQVIGKPSKLQDFSRFPDYNKGLDKLMAGTTFWSLISFSQAARCFGVMLASSDISKDVRPKGGVTEAGWVGDTTSPTMSVSVGTGMSWTGWIGLPVTRSRRNRRLALLITATAGMTRPSFFTSTRVVSGRS